MTTKHFPDDAGDGTVTYRREDRIARITLNRPHKLNAFNARMLTGVGQALEWFDDDDEAWVCILDGEGRAFSTGADVLERQSLPLEEQRRTGGPGHRGPPTLFLQNAVNWKPVIAAVHGYAYGIGLSLLLDADLCVATEDLQMEITEVRRGLWGHFHWLRLHARGSTAFADEVALLGRSFSGLEAANAGVITCAVPDGEHLTRAHELADRLLSMPPMAVRCVVHARRYTLQRAEETYPVLRSAHPLHLTEDFTESTNAFLEKRKPNPYIAR